MQTVTIAPMEARQVLWHLREPGGIEPGSFVAKLLTAMAAAEPGNLRRLGLGFPGYAAAMALALHDADGPARLQEIAGVTLCATCRSTGLVRRELPAVTAVGDVSHVVACPACRGTGTT
jgi:hypothetical protein